MKLTRPDIAAYVIAGLALVGIVVLTALKVPVPDFLTFAGTTALGIGGGVALQGATTTTDAAPAPVAAPAPTAPQALAPQALTSEPATGVFRVASHAP